MKRSTLLEHLREQALQSGIDYSETDTDNFTIIRVGRAQFLLSHHSEIAELAARQLLAQVSHEFGVPIVIPRSFTVHAEKSGDWWVLQAAEAPGAIAQVRQLSDSPQIIEAIAIVTGLPEAEIVIDLVTELPLGK